jgi:hypothetical protein
MGIRVQRESNEKIEQQIISFCRSTGDEGVIEALEQNSADLGAKMVVRSTQMGVRSSRREGRGKEKNASSGKSSVCSSVVNVSIDGVTQSNTSQSARSLTSSLSSSSWSNLSKRRS